MQQAVVASFHQSVICHAPIWVVATRAVDNACTWCFIVLGMTLRDWVDFVLVACEQGEI